MDVKYFSIYPEHTFFSWDVKGTYQAALAFGINKLKEEGLTEDKFPFKWETIYGHLDKDGKDVIDKVVPHVCNSYEELLCIEEVSQEDFLESLGEDDYEKGEQWCLNHMDDWFEIL